MKDYRSHLEPQNYYHIFNHAVGQENLFIEDKNYKFFLEKFEKYLVEFVDVYAYCLMPNHFHFLIRVKVLETNCQTTSKVSDSLSYNILSNAFKKFFTSYTNSINKVYKKRGSLFQPRFKRLLIENENHLLNTVTYIHNNPVLHGFVDKITDWPYSSYNYIVGENKLDWFNPIKAVSLFDDISNFIFSHNNICDLDDIED